MDALARNGLILNFKVLENLELIGKFLKKTFHEINVTAKKDGSRF